MQLEPNLITHNAAISACQGGKEFIAGQLYCKSSSSDGFLTKSYKVICEAIRLR